MSKRSLFVTSRKEGGKAREVVSELSETSGFGRGRSDLRKGFELCVYVCPYAWAGILCMQDKCEMQECSVGKKQSFHFLLRVCFEDRDSDIGLAWGCSSQSFSHESS